MAFRKELLLAPLARLATTKDASSTFELSNPDIGPQSRPTARAAMIK